MTTHTSDARLVAGHLAGDPAALAGIYDRYADSLHDTAAAMLNDRSEAADVLQDVILVAAERLEQLRDPDRLKPWLFAILRNEVYRRTRQRRRTIVTDFSGSDGDTSGPDMTDHRMGDPGDTTTDGIAADELAELVRNAARGLDERDQLVLELSVRQGLGGQDLADALGVSANQSYTLVHRMRDRVERSLGAYAVARAGRRDCDDLDRLLASWDGEFSILIRKRVARHIEACDTCERRRATVVPFAMFAAAPVYAAPIELRDRILAGARSAPSTPYRFVADGGFPTIVRTATRVAAWVAPAAAAVLLLLVGGVVVTFAAAGGDPGDIASLDAVVSPATDPVPTMATDATPPSTTPATTPITTTATPTTSNTRVATPTTTSDTTPTATRPTGPATTVAPTTAPPTTRPPAPAPPTPAPPGAAPPAPTPGPAPAPTAPPAPTPAPAPTPTPITPTSTTTAATTTTAAPVAGSVVVSGGAIDLGQGSFNGSLTVSNPGDLPVDFTVTGSPGAFSVSPTTGTLDGATSAQLVASLDRSGLPEGPVGPVTVEVRGAGSTSPVTLTARVERPPVFGASSGRGSCFATNDPQTNDVVVSTQAGITDESSISATMSTSGPNGQSATSAMNPDGPTWFGSVTLTYPPNDPGQATGTWTWSITATDSRGNTASTSGSVTVTGC